MLKGSRKLNFHQRLVSLYNNSDNLQGALGLYHSHTKTNVSTESQLSLRHRLGHKGRQDPLGILPLLVGPAAEQCELVTSDPTTERQGSFTYSTEFT